MNLYLSLAVAVLLLLVSVQTWLLRQYRRRCRFNDRFEKILEERQVLMCQVLHLTREQLARAQFDARMMNSLLQQRFQRGQAPETGDEADWWKKP